MRPPPAGAVRTGALGGIGPFARRGPAGLETRFMVENGDIRTGRHCAFVPHAHLVFVTKFRHPVFKGAHLERMEKSCGTCARNSSANWPSSTVRPTTCTCWWTSRQWLHCLGSSTRRRGVLPAAATGVLRAGPSLLAGEQAWSAPLSPGSVGRAPIRRPAPVHRTAGSPCPATREGPLHPLGLKVGALWTKPAAPHGVRTVGARVLERPPRRRPIARRRGGSL